MTLHKVVSAVAILSIPLLAACAGASNTQGDFLCPAQTGNGSPCSTIGEADGRNQASGTPVAERFSDTLGKEMSRNPLSYASGKGGGAAGAPLTGMTDGGMAYTATQYRVPEQVGTLWVAPHLDGEGLLHEATFVHFVVREAQWTSGRS